MKSTFIVCTAFFLLKPADFFPHPNEFELLILHNNDMHARFEETSRRSSVCKSNDKEKKECYGGFARTAHVIREARKAALDGTGPNVIYLNGGDTYTGTQWFGVHKSKIVAEFLNILRPDALSFGNHEFDLRIDGVLPFIKAAKFPIIAANLDFSKEPRLQATNVSKSVVFEIAGRKIGVIGYLTPETLEIASPEKIIFNSEVQSIKQESEKLDKQGVKIIIALGHSGIQMDVRIAKEVPLVDIVVGGHSNTFLWNGQQPDAEEPYGPYPLVVKQATGKNVYVVQAFAYTKYMGHLNVKFNSAGDVVACEGQPKLLNNNIPQDQDVLDLLEKYRPEIDALNKESIGKTKVVLDGAAESCRFKECNFGSLIADAIIAHHAYSYTGTYWTDAPIAFFNGGNIRNTIEPANSSDVITRGDIMAVLPFENTLVILTLQGKDLIQALEQGARGNGETSGGEFLQVSGLHVVYDLARPAGARVVSVKARCGQCSIPVYESVDSTKSYRVITTKFLEGGGDGHTAISEKGSDMFFKEDIEADALVWYLKKFSPVYPEEDGRLVIKKDNNKSVANLAVANFSLSLLLVVCLLSIS